MKQTGMIAHVKVGGIVTKMTPSIKAPQFASEHVESVMESLRLLR